MNTKTKRSPKKESGSCLCQGGGPLLSDLLRRLGPPLAARRHFDVARIELLKGLRAVLDARIAQISKGGAKGEKISVE